MKFNFSVSAFQDEVRDLDDRAADQVVEAYTDRLLTPGEEETVEERRERLSFSRGIALDLVRGLLPVSKEVFIARMHTCMDCEKVRIIAGGEQTKLKIIQCTECSCVMNAKARFRSSACPLGKF